MLKCHNINGLEGKVSMNFIDMYKRDHRNFLISSIIAGFHRSYGLRNEGISMSMEIVNNIEDDTDNMQYRCLLVWNLYSLIDEFIEEDNLDEAMKLAARAERNWTRDIVLGDEMGVYHVSWLEQIWHKQAEIFHLIGDKSKFRVMTDKIISSRLCLFQKASEITGESIQFDRCAYSCLELMAFEARKSDIHRAIKCIKAAITIKGGYLNECGLDTDYQSKSSFELSHYFSKCLKYYYSLCEQSYDNIEYTYCSSCENYSADMKCKEMNVNSKKYGCCSKYINKVHLM